MAYSHVKGLAWFILFAHDNVGVESIIELYLFHFLTFIICMAQLMHCPVGHLLH